MASALPPPAKPGKLTVFGDATLDLLSSSPVILQPGSGETARVSGRTIIIDNAFSEPTEDHCLTVAGTPPAAGAQLGLWRNTSRSQQVYIRKLEAFFRTAQTTADVANYYRLRAIGSISGAAVLPFTAATKSFLLDQGYGAVIDQGLDPSSGSAGLSLGSSPGPAFAWQMIPSQTQLLTGITCKGLAVSFQSFGGLGFGVPATPIRCAILDAGGNIITSAHSPALTTALTDVAFLFPTSVQLVAGTTYYLAFDILESYPVFTGTVGQGVNDCNAFPAFGIPSPANEWTNGVSTLGLPDRFHSPTGKRLFVAAAPSAYGMDAASTAAAYRALTWPALIAGTAQVPYGGVQLLQAGTAHLYHWYANGSPSGLAAVKGDVSFAIDTVGAPPGTGLGSDLTIHAVLAQS